LWAVAFACLAVGNLRERCPAPDPSRRGPGHGDRGDVSASRLAPPPRGAGGAAGASSASLTTSRAEDTLSLPGDAVGVVTCKLLP